MNSRRWLILIVVAGALLRFFPIWFGLPYLLARPDEEVATGIAGKVLDGDFNPRFFHWPSLIFYVFAALYWVAEVVRPLLGDSRELSAIEQVIIGRVFVACAGVATLVVVYRIGRRLANDAVGLIAAALLAVAVLHVRESHFAMTDVLMTLFVTISLALLLWGSDAPGSRHRILIFALAGVAGGLATSTKYSAVAVLASAGTAQVLTLKPFRRSVLRWRMWLPACAFLATFAVGFLSTSPFTVLDPGAFYRGLLFNYVHARHGHGLDVGRGFSYHATYSLPFGLGITAFAASVIGLSVLAIRRRGWVLLSFGVGLYLSLAPSRTVFFRYVLPLLPVLCVSAALAITVVATWVSARNPGRGRVALVALTLFAIVPGFVNSLWLDVVLSRRDTRLLASGWLLAQVRPEHSLYDGGSVYTRLDLKDASFHECFLDPATNTVQGADGRTPDWLIVYKSPLVLYADTPPVVVELAQRQYTLVYAVRGTGPAAGAAVYDLYDAFFVPVWGAWTVERPGPDIQIYRRNSANGHLQLSPLPGLDAVGGRAAALAAR